MTAEGPDVAVWLVQFSEETGSPGVVQGNLQAVRCFRKNAVFPLGKIHIVTGVIKGLKILDAKSINRLGFEPEMFQVLLKLSLEEKGTKDFVGLRQAAMYIIMYWCTARFEEADDLRIGQIVKRGSSLQVNIKKGKMNQDRRLQQMYIHPNSSGQVGNFDPVNVLEEYITIRKKFFNTNLEDYMFPNLSSVWDVRTWQQVISLKQPIEPMKYDNFRNRFKAHLEHTDLASLGVTTDQGGFRNTQFLYWWS